MRLNCLPMRALGIVFRCLLLAAMWLVGSTAAFASSTVGWGYWLDDTGAHTIQQVRQLPDTAFIPMDAQRLPKLQPYQVVWLRVTVPNPQDQPQPWVLEVRNLRIPDLQVFEPLQDTPAQQTGFRASATDQPVPHRYFAVPVVVAAQSEKAMHLRVSLGSRTDLLLVPWKLEDFQRYQLDDHALQMGYFGLAIGLILFNALLGLALRDRLYAFYVGFVVFMVLNVAATSGMGRLYLWPQAVWWSQFGNLVAGLAATYCLAEFLLRLLNLPQAAPGMARLLGWNQRLQLVGLLALVLVGEAAFRWVLLLPVISVVVSLVVTVRGTWQRLPGAALVLVAFVALMVGTVLNTLWTFQWAPDMAMSRYGVQIGSALEMLLLSLSLADRFVRLHQAKVAAESDARQAHEEALHAERARVDALQATEQLLESRVTERTTALEQALTRLQQAQHDLIQAEKLSALGSMVAGVSHELNTPLGVIVTASTAMGERSTALANAFATGQLTRTQAQHDLRDMVDASDLIHKSAERAAALVSSFKQVAVDQVSERRREFDLHQVVEENLRAIRASLKCEPWPVVNEVPPGLTCESFPGPLGQVLTNLVMNAIHHGFANRPLGQVVIGARHEDARVVLWVQDNGVGMDARTVARVFEPFFTTRLGQGGSGLGLAVSHRIATTLLQGDLRVESRLGAGTTFTVSFARVSSLGG